MPSFKEKVYRVVARIPRGNVLTYKEVAWRAGRLRAYRAHVNILNAHRIPGLPYHRVIRNDGTAGGYRWGVNKKELLLREEGFSKKKFK